MQYSWKIKDPSLSILFKKHLSKHSVRAYMRLYREVGRSFNAIHREIPSPVSIPPLEVDKDEAMSELNGRCHFQQPTDENYRLAEELKEVNERLKVLEEANAAAEKKMRTQEAMLQEAQTTIQFYQQDAQQWMTVAGTYQNSCVQCSNALSQLISFIEGIQSQISIISPKSAQL